MNLTNYLTSKNKIKVLFIIDTLNIGGAEKSLLEIISKFKKYIPIVCTVYKGNILKNEYEKFGIKVYALDIEDRFGYNKAIKSISKIIMEENVCLIHSTLYRSDIISRRIKQLINLPIINSFVNNSYSKERYQRNNIFGRCKIFYYQMRDRFTCGNVNLFISNSDTIRRTNSKALGIPVSKIRVIYRGRCYTKYSNNELIDKEYSTIEKSFSNKKIILNVSRLIPRKGQGDLIEAYNLLRPELKRDSVLLIAGEGPFRNDLELIIKKYNLENNIYLLGEIDNIPKLLFDATCFVFPSYFEGLPGAIIEAMMAGKIIIASDIPENRECLDNKSALFFQPGKIKDLCLMIENVLENPSKYSSYGKNAQILSKAKFRVEDIALQYESIYDGFTIML